MLTLNTSGCVQYRYPGVLLDDNGTYCAWRGLGSSWVSWVRPMPEVWFGSYEKSYHLHSKDRHEVSRRIHRRPCFSVQRSALMCSQNASHLATHSAAMMEPSVSRGTNLIRGAGTTDLRSNSPEPNCDGGQGGWRSGCHSAE